MLETKRIQEDTIEKEIIHARDLDSKIGNFKDLD